MEVCGWCQGYGEYPDDECSLHRAGPALVAALKSALAAMRLQQAIDRDDGWIPLIKQAEGAIGLIDSLLKT